MCSKPLSIACCPRPSTATRSLASSGYIDQLDGVSMQPCRTLATVIDQVHQRPCPGSFAPGWLHALSASVSCDAARLRGSHLRQELPSFRSLGRCIAYLHPLQIRASFTHIHFVFGRHRSPRSVTFSFE